MVRIYIRQVIWWTIATLVYGFLVPTLISMKDTVAVISGFGLALITPPCLFALFKGFVMAGKKK